MLGILTFPRHITLQLITSTCIKFPDKYNREILIYKIIMRIISAESFNIYGLLLAITTFYSFGFFSPNMNCQCSLWVCDTSPGYIQVGDDNVDDAVLVIVTGVIAVCLLLRI